MIFFFREGEDCEFDNYLNFLWLFKLLVADTSSFAQSPNSFDCPYFLVCPVISKILQSGKLITKLIIMYESSLLRISVEKKEMVKRGVRNKLGNEVGHNEYILGFTKYGFNWKGSRILMTGHGTRW